MELSGITVDVPVSDLVASEAFYTVVLGRGPDRSPAGQPLEWILSRTPEIALRLVAGQAVAPDRVRVGLGVADLDAERRWLIGLLAAVAEIAVRPGVIAELELRDPDGYRVVLWQDLLAR